MHSAESHPPPLGGQCVRGAGKAGAAVGSLMGGSEALLSSGAALGATVATNSSDSPVTALRVRQIISMLGGT